MKSSLKILVMLIVAVCSQAFAQSEVNNIDIEYRVTAIMKGDNEIQSESNIVSVKPPLSISIPNAFTPNGDGLNDSFSVLGDGIESVRMQIFNRWGELLFETDNLEEAWDGNYNGKKVLPGAYIYNVEIAGFYSENVNKKGTVTVVNL